MKIHSYPIGFYLLSSMLLFSVFEMPTFARETNSIELSSNVIKSAESCKNNYTSDSGKEAVQLHCTTYHQTTVYTCGPSAVMTLMHYYNKLSASELNQKTEMRIASEMGAIAESGGGTSLTQMTSWLSSHGFSVDSGERVSSDMLISNVRRGIPTIISFDNHWIIAKGYRPGGPLTYQNKAEIIFSDSCCGTKMIPADVIDSMWAVSKLPGSHCAGNIGEYIVAVPN